MIGVSQQKWHRFAVGYLTGQGIMWIKILALLELRFIEHPVREFPKATDIGFTLDFFFYPVLYALFVILHPRGSLKRTALHLVIWSVCLSCLDYMIAEYTDLLEYIKMNFLWSVIFFSVALIIADIVNRWFFSENTKMSEGR